MKLLSTIYRNKGANPEGKTFQREAVRGVIFRDGELLMIYSTVNGDYKFPGGGIEADELHAEALQREIQEECGAEKLYHIIFITAGIEIICIDD